MVKATKKKPRKPTARSTAAKTKARKARPLRILLTGFGPFPGAPVNPTGDLILCLTRRMRAAIRDVRISTHVFPTTYAAVDRDLPRLLAHRKPDILLMFGLATRSRGIHVETRARNLISRSADAAGVTPEPAVIVADGPRTLPVRAPCVALLRAAKTGGIPARLSVNAGSYLCNYLYWRALEAADQTGGPARAVFIHVPLVDVEQATAQRRRRTRPQTMHDLADGAEAIAKALIRAARARR